MWCSFFTGGDQSRLTALLKNSELINIIKKRYTKIKIFLLAGTSAGGNGNQ